MTPGREWIAYVGPFSFPWGQPGSRRVCGVAQSMASAGYNMVVASGDWDPPAVTVLKKGDETGSVSYVGLGESLTAADSIISKSLDVFVRWGRKTVAWLDAQTTKPSHVIVYGGSAQYMHQLQWWCRRNRVPLVADVVEWYSPRQMRGGLFGPAHLSAKFALRYQYPRCDGIIAISSFLAEHYRSRGCRVVRVPPTLDVQGVTSRAGVPPPDPEMLTLVYAGTPGRKDSIAQIARGLRQADPGGHKMRLLLVGPSAAELRGLLNEHELSPGIRALGRVPQQSVSEILQTADFSVLLRDPLRFAHAGFPTKFVESLANATPVIANLTSDLGEYLHDGVEGLVCRGNTAEAFSQTLRRASLLSAEQRKSMRQAALAQALHSFDFRRHAEPLSVFLEDVRG